MPDMYGMDEEIDTPDTGGSTPAPVPITSFKDYSQSRVGTDPFEVYRDYVGTVFPSQLKANGYNQQQIEQTQLQLMQRLPPPPRNPEDFLGKDQGVVGNAVGSIGRALGGIGTELTAATTAITGDKKGLYRAMREQEAQEKSAPPGLRKFREIAGEGTGVWDFLSNTAKATYESPEGAADAFLEMLTGFAPIMAGATVGGIAGTAAGPIIGNVTGGALGMAGTSAALELGAKSLSKLRQGLAEDKIDPSDETAVLRWLEEKGAEKVFGPAARAAYTNGALTLIAGGLAGRLSEAAGETLGVLERAGARGASQAEVQGLRQGVRNYELGSLAANAGGFTAASAGGSLAAGDEVRARDLFESALTMALPGAVHLRGKTKAAKGLQAEIEAKRGEALAQKYTELEKPPVEKELTEAEQEKLLREEDKPSVGDTAAAVATAQDIVKEVNEARYQTAAEQVKAELEARQQQRTGTPPITEPTAGTEAGRSDLQPTGVPADQPRVVEADKVEPVDRAGVGVGEEGTGQGLAGRPESREPTGVVGPDSEAVAGRPVVPERDTGGTAAVGEPSKIAQAKARHAETKAKEEAQRVAADKAAQERGVIDLPVGTEVVLTNEAQLDPRIQSELKGAPATIISKHRGKYTLANEHSVNGGVTATPHDIQKVGGKGIDPKEAILRKYIGPTAAEGYRNSKNKEAYWDYLAGEEMRKEYEKALGITNPASADLPVGERGARQYLDDSQYFYHAVRNDADIAGIVKEGLRPGTNVSVTKDGQAFNEGETILVFRKGDYRTRSKGYQDDHVVVGGSGKPVAILKDTESHTKESGAAAADRQEKAYGKFLEERDMIARTLDLDPDVYEKLMYQAAMNRRNPEVTKEMKKQLGEWYDRTLELERKQDAIFKDMERSQDADAPAVTKQDVLGRYTEHGIPVKAIRLGYDDKTDTTTVNPASLTPTHEVANDYRQQITEANLDLTRAQIKGDTRAEAQAAERIATLQREAKDWLEITSALEAEKINKALYVLLRNGAIKENDAGFYRALTESDTVEALKQLASNKKATLMNRALAKQLLKINVAPETRFIGLETKRNLGEYSMGLDTVLLDAGYFLQRIAHNDPRKLDTTFLHEVMHAATFNALMKAYRVFKSPNPEAYGTIEYRASPEYKSAVKLFETFEWLKNNAKPLSWDEAAKIFEREGIALDGTYGVIDKPNKYSLRKWGTQEAVDHNTLTGEAKDAWDRLDRRNDWQKEVFGNIFDPKYHYGATNPAELVAEIFINPRLQEYLKGVILPHELTGGLPKNAWQAVLDWIKTTLGLKGMENNALEAIMAHTSQVARERNDLPPMSKYNRALPTLAEIAGNHQFYTDYPVSNTKKTQNAKDATEQLQRELGNPTNPGSEAPPEPKAPRTAIKGVNDKTDRRESIAYLQKDGKYNYYEVTEEHPTGDTETKLIGLTRDEVLRKNEGRRIDAAAAEPEPKTSRSGLQGWRNGRWQFGAIAMKDENGKPTGEWRVTTGDDLQDKSSPRERVTLDSYDEVRRMFGEGGYSRTKKFDAAKDVDRSGLPELDYTPPSEFSQIVADKGGAVKNLGTQALYQAEKDGLLLPLSMRPDLAAIRKNALIENDVTRLMEEPAKKLQTEGRALLDRFKRSGKQFDEDITKLSYQDRASKLLASNTYDATPDAKAQVVAQLAEANQHMLQLDPAYRTELMAYAKKWKKYANDAQDFMADAGLITRQQADDVKNRYDFYVPMRTDEKSTLGKRATGLSDESTDPLLRIVNDWRIAVKRKYDNEETKATYKLAEAFNIKKPDGTPLFDLAPITKYAFDQHGELTGVVDPLVLSKKAVVAMIDGVPYRMAVNDKALLSALERVPADQTYMALRTAMHGMAMFNAVLGGLKTAASPVFAVKNLIRDTAAALIQGDERLDRAVLTGELASKDTWKAAIQNAGEPWHKSKPSEAEQQGALISRRGMVGLIPERENPTVNLDPTLLQRAGDLRRNTLSFEHGKLSNLMTFATKMTENVTRIAVYSAAMKSPKMWESVGKRNGTTGPAVEVALRKTQRGQPLTADEKTLITHLQAESAAIAKTATVNFEPKGKVSGLVNALFIFANAKVQGARTFGERLGLSTIRGGNTPWERLQRSNRYTQYSTAGMLAAGIAAALYGYKNDPDNYGNLSDYQKDDYGTVKSGGLSVPLPQEPAIAWTLGQSIVDAMMNPRYPDASMRRWKAASRMGTRFIQSFWPGGSAMSDPMNPEAGRTADFAARLVTPTIGQMAHDLGSNRNTFGSPIVTGLTDNMPRKGVPIYQHNAQKVSPLARGLASGAHQVGFDFAPQSAQYVVDQFIKQNVDFVHAIAPTWEFFNSVFGEPKKDPQGVDRPNSFKRTFFQEASELADKETLQEVISFENNKLRDTGQTKSERLNLLKQGEKRAAELFKGYDKMTQEQINAHSKQAAEIRRNTLKRYREEFAQ